MNETPIDVDTLSRAIADQVAGRARDALTRASTANEQLSAALEDSADAQRRAAVARAELRAAVTEAMAANVTPEHLDSLGISPRLYRKTTTRTPRKKSAPVPVRGTRKASSEPSVP